MRFLDPHGFTWHAVEVPSRGAVLSEGTLYFFSGGSTRALHSYPADWSDRAWAELECLRQGARVMSEDAARRSGEHPATA